MAKADPALLQEAINAVQKHGSVTNAAKELGIPRKTLSGRYNKAKDLGLTAGGPVFSVDQEIAVDTQLKRMSQEKRDTERKYKEVLKQLEDKDRALEEFGNFQQLVDGALLEPISITKKNKKDSEVTPVLCYSDLHFEEHVDGRTIDGLNEYNTKIARQRSDRFFQNSVKLIDMCRNKSNIRTLVLWLGGDLINGYIHEEFEETNLLTPVESCLEVYQLVINGIDFLLEHSGCEEIVIVENVGNHARTTDRQRAGTNVQNSYEWLIYNFIAQHYENDPRIKFKLTMGYFNNLNVYGYKLRFHHGENVRYAGGVGGLSIPLNKAIAMWNQATVADIDILGHWHQRTSHKNFIVNGSIIGFNAYALKIKASFERPQQSFFLMDPRWGKTVEAPIFLD